MVTYQCLKRNYISFVCTKWFSFIRKMCYICMHKVIYFH